LSEQFLREMLRAPSSSWGLMNESTGALVAQHLIPAFDRRSRNQGLLRRAGLRSGEALILAPCSSVHTWFMQFPIDIVFVSRAGEVLKVRPAVGPWRLAARLGAFAVIEWGAGGARGVQRGHRLGLRSLQTEGDRVDAN
jgi:uncharacterized protein